jgi:hypothetical protein
MVIPHGHHAIIERACQREWIPTDSLPFFYVVIGGRSTAMPKVIKEYPITIGYRDSEAGVRKLEELSKQTGRSRAEVLRLLVSLAVPTNLPTLQLAAQTESMDMCDRAPA